MRLKDKIKSYSFWVSLTSAIILIMKILGSRFGFTVDETMVSDLFTAMCSILVLLGIIVPPTNANNITNTIENNLSENNIQQCNDEKTKINNAEEKNINKNNQQPEPEEIVISKKEEVIQNNNEEQTLSPVETINTTEEYQEVTIIKENNEQKNNNDLNQIFFEIKNKFSGNIEAYIHELQEELRKTREGM